MLQYEIIANFRVLNSEVPEVLPILLLQNEMKK